MTFQQVFFGHIASRIAIIGALCVFVFLAGCGIQGPAGPAGPQGPVGPQGPAGPAGNSGSSARVVNITVQPAQWQVDMSSVGVAGAYLQSGWFTASNITQDVMNSGVVLVFMQMNSNPATWQQLPVTYYGSSSFRVIDCQYRLNQVQIFINNSGTAAPGLPTSAFNYRIVAITGTTTAVLKQTVDITNYAAVKAAFHLAE